jgi:5-(carboxyamino)imidazole ribonucleotide synthase
MSATRARRAADRCAGHLGVLGGGQLGRMFVHAAQVHGFRVSRCSTPMPTARPACRRPALCARPTTDEAALASWPACSAVTTEFENVPAARCARWPRLPWRRAADAVRICQHRAPEKRTSRGSGVPCAPFALVDPTRRRWPPCPPRCCPAS